MTNTILALDFGKFNSVLCWFEADSRNFVFRTVKTIHDELRRELTRQPVSQVVFEGCDRDAGSQPLRRRVHRGSRRAEARTRTMPVLRKSR